MRLIVPIPGLTRRSRVAARNARGAVLGKLLPVLILIGAVLVAMLLAASKREAPRKPDVQRATLVDVMPVERRDVEFKIQSQGTVRPRTETTLVAQVSGTIESVATAFEAGGFFRQGETLLQIDPRDYQVNVMQAEANLASARAQLALETAQAKQAAKDWEQLGGRRGAPSDLVLRKPQVAGAEAAVEAAEADLARARRDLERTTVKAPYDGMVRSKLADLGQFVTNGAQLAEIFAVDSAEIRLPLSDRDLAYISLPDTSETTPTDDSGAVPTATLIAEVAGKLHRWETPIVRTEGVIDEQTRLTYVVARINDPYGLRPNEGDSPPLRVGTFVQAEIQGLGASDVFAVPRYLVRGDNQLMVIDEDNRLRMRELEVIRADREYVYVGSGLQSGERVVTTAIDTPIDGMALRTPDSAESSPTAGAPAAVAGGDL